MADEQAEAAKKTTVGYAAAAIGPFTAIGGMVGDIVLPDTEVPVGKFQANDDTKPSLIPGDAVVGDAEITVKYAGHAAHALLSALLGTAQFIEFTLQGGDSFIYGAIVSKVGPASSADNGALVGKIGFVFSHLESSTAAA